MTAVIYRQREAEDVGDMVMQESLVFVKVAFMTGKKKRSFYTKQWSPGASLWEEWSTISKDEAQGGL